MDVERSIDSIEIEAAVDHKFDDIKLISNGIEYFFQIKDFANVSLADIKISGNNISISGKPHPFSEAQNVLVFNNIEITPDCEILGFPAYKYGKIHIISLSRVQLELMIEALYKTDHLRKYLIDKFFSECLDNRRLHISKADLPVLNIFKTKLIEASVNIAREILDIENILHIEGKPGVGKSHLVVNLEKQYENNIVYRFWVSNQDSEYRERLQYGNFLLDFSKKLFGNLKPYSEADIIAAIVKLEKMVIIDGLDHVENYNSAELPLFVGFINDLQEKCKVIVLSRPLLYKLTWKQQLLLNWNHDQTKVVLNELYHIDDYETVREIYRISDGYPILVRYIAEQYKFEGKVPDFEAFDSIDKYYDELVKEKGKKALSLFLCIRSFIMQSEVSLLLDTNHADFVNEFVSDHPYLFELRLNRISLFHDSFITYLRKQNTKYQLILDKVNEVAYASIINGDKRFMSRFTAFDFTIAQKKNVVMKYASFVEFSKLQPGVVDFEAMRDFYHQLRETLTLFSHNDFEAILYYDLSMIINMVTRDHISSLNGFHYTYCQSLLFNGYDLDDITSNRYLFGMFYYLKTNDGSLILNATSDDHYDTSRFYSDLQSDVLEEVNFFEKHKKPLTVARIKTLLKDKSNWEYRKIITYILEDLFIHDLARKNYIDLYKAIKSYMKGEDYKATYILEPIIADLGLDGGYEASWILKEARENLLALGMVQKKNEYLKLTLRQFIHRHRQDGSFTMWVDILNYMRLALHHNRKIDLDAISLFWTKYYQRKDHSLYSLDVALPVFEQKGYVEMFASVHLIGKIQDMSEKGYRGLLADYITQHPPSFIAQILDSFHPTNLSISWFLLPPEYINVLPDLVYNIELRNQLKYHRHSRNIEYRDVENLLDSNRLDQFREDLVFHRYSVWLDERSPEISKLKKLKIPYTTYRGNNYDEYATPDSSRLEQGILDHRNIEAIAENGLKPQEVASFADGNYIALSDPDIYRVFAKEEIRDNITAILYNAMVSKSRTIDHFHILWSYPGNVIKLLHDNEVIEDFEQYFRNFLLYLELSMFGLDNKFSKNE